MVNMIKLKEILIVTLFSFNGAMAAPQGFVSLKAADPTIVIEMRYSVSHNFVGKAVDGYKANICYVTTPAATALKKVQAELKTYQLSLKMYDCYRPQRAVDHFVEWASDLNDQKMKNEFYPRVQKENLFRDGYIATRSGHSRGSTVDLTIVPADATPQMEPVSQENLLSCINEKRFPDNSLNMGVGFDCFDPLSAVLQKEVSAQARANRMLLQALMSKHGFRSLAEEWWHFTLINEPYPNQYFDFLVE